MTTLPRSLKITSTHLQRKAVVYVRQSTPKQVRSNTESQRNQRALVERAVALGWDQSRIVVLDADLGRAFRFTRLVALAFQVTIVVLLGSENQNAASLRQHFSRPNNPLTPVFHYLLQLMSLELP